MVWYGVVWVWVWWVWCGMVWYEYIVFLSHSKHRLGMGHTITHRLGMGPTITYPDPSSAQAGNQTHSHIDWE